MSSQRRFAAQIELAIEPELQRATFIPEQFFDDQSFARAGGLQDDYFAAGFAHDGQAAGAISVAKLR